MSRQTLPSPVLTNIYQGLTDEEISARFPSVFAEQPHESRSSRYLMVPTYEILSGLRENGFVPTTVMQQRSRVEGQVSHGKHLLRLRPIDYLGTTLQEAPEVVMYNSHNGASGMGFMTGYVRFICENGCISMDASNSLKVQHRGSSDMLDAILEAVFKIAAESVKVMEEIAVMKEIMLSWDEQLMLAEAAMVHRFPDKVKIVESDNGLAIDRSMVPFQPSDFLRPRRLEDGFGENRQRSLYVAYQNLQETMVEKPTTSRQRGSNGRRGSIRSLNGITDNVRMNSTLHYLAQQMAKEKQK